MSSSRQIKRRIKSAKNISQITKAMEMVSASKMKRAQNQALSSRPYSDKLASTLKTIANFTDPSLHPLLQLNDSEKVLIILISSDRGLAGSLSTTLFKYAEEFSKDRDVEFIVVGRKSREYAQKFGRTIVAEFNGLPDRVHVEQALPIAEIVTTAFQEKKYGSIYLLHMQFLSTLSQKPLMQQLLPLSYETFEETTEHLTVKPEYAFEPNPKEVLDFLLPYYIEMTIFQTLLDSKASEHSARMVAMKSASDNAKEIVDELQLIYNKSRQANITKELLDMTTATLSVAQ